MNIKETSINIERIIRDNKLDLFIIGKDEFLSSQMQDDYARWNILIDFFHNLEETSDLKETIKETIVELLDYTDPKAKYASLDLARLLSIKEIENKLVKYIEQQKDFLNLPLYVQNEFLYVATKLQISAISGPVIEILFKNNKLKDYILWSSTTEYVTHIVGQDDLWRVNNLQKFYEESDDNTKKLVQDQLVNSAIKYRKVKSIFQKFLDVAENRSQFYKMINVILNK